MTVTMMKRTAVTYGVSVMSDSDIQRGFQSKYHRWLARFITYATLIAMAFSVLFSFLIGAWLVLTATGIL